MLTRHLVEVSYGGNAATLIINAPTSSHAMKCAERWISERTESPVCSIAVFPKGPALYPTRRPGVVYVCLDRRCP